MNNNEQLNSKNQISHTDKNNKNKIILNKTNIKVFETNQPVKIEYLSAKKTEIENLSDEYSELSFLNNLNCETNKNNKKSVEYDFRNKYKTEKCKFWEINKICKYGDSVIWLIFYFKKFKTYL